jgi:hypothetical protein
VAVPPETAVTKPVLLTAAIPEFEETHGLIEFAVAEPVSCDVDPEHAVNVPVIVGTAFAVNETEFVVVEIVPELVVVLTTQE